MKAGSDLRTYWVDGSRNCEHPGSGTTVWLVPGAAKDAVRGLLLRSSLLSYFTSNASNDAAPRQGAELTPLPAPAICWHAGSNTYNNSSPMSAKASASAQAQISRLFPFS
eukprot:933434-Pelagomonas_calceolata.AAC.20